MTLWEREQFEAQEAEVERKRAERVRQLEEQRQAEMAEARRREEEFRLQDDERERREHAKREEEAAARAAETEALVAKARAEQEALDAQMALEQKRLADEMARKKEQAAAKEEATAAALKRQGSSDYSYGFEEGMEAKVKAFQQRGRGGDAMIIKIDHDKNELQIEEHKKGLASVEALAELLEDTEPRYLLYIHTVKHSDGRVQYPIAFMLYMPDQVRAPSPPPPLSRAGASSRALGRVQSSRFGPTLYGYTPLRSRCSRRDGDPTPACPVCPRLSPFVPLVPCCAGAALLHRCSCPSTSR